MGQTTTATCRAARRIAERVHLAWLRTGNVRSAGDIAQNEIEKDDALEPCGEYFCTGCGWSGDEPDVKITREATRLDPPEYADPKCPKCGREVEAT